MVFCSDSTIPIGERLKPPAQSARDDAIRRLALPTRVGIAVVGAGVIGLSIAWRLARRGMSVAVFERAESGTGTSLAATGMLAAAAEHEPGGDDLLTLALESQRLWPQFRSELESDSDLSIDYRPEGTLVVALGRDEVERLRFRYEYQQRSGLDARWLSGLEARSLEPGLRPSVAAGVACDSDHQVDPRLLIPALVRALQSRGGRLFENCPVTSLETSGGRISGLVTAAGVCQARTVIVANGVWAADILSPHGIDIPLRPLKGQALALKATKQTSTLSHVVWTEQIHLAPKSDGRLIVGSTMEDAGFNSAITAGGTLALLEGVHRALPSSEEMEIEAIWSGFRPTTDDDSPVLGPTGVQGLLIATGHHRNGVLLAPVTAAALEGLVTAGAMTGAAPLFGLDRFQGAQPKQALAAGARR
jgi:glycine oxidase